MAKGLIQAAHWRLSTLIVSETALIAGTIWVAAYARIGAAASPFAAPHVLPKALLAACVCQICLYYSDLYDDPRAGGDHSELLVRTVQALGMTLLVLAVMYMWFPVLTIGSGVIAPGVTFAAAGVIAWRITFTWLTRQVGPTQRLLLVGLNASGASLARELHAREELGVDIIGYVGVGDVAFPGLLPRLGTVEEFAAVAVLLCSARASYVTGETVAVDGGLLRSVF